jgi:hypothetical protein
VMTRIFGRCFGGIQCLLVAGTRGGTDHLGRISKQVPNLGT